MIRTISSRVVMNEYKTELLSFHVNNNINDNDNSNNIINNTINHEDVEKEVSKRSTSIVGNSSSSSSSTLLRGNRDSIITKKNEEVVSSWTVVPEEEGDEKRRDIVLQSSSSSSSSNSTHINATILPEKDDTNLPISSSASSSSSLLLPPTTGDDDDNNNKNDAPNTSLPQSSLPQRPEYNRTKIASIVGSETGYREMPHKHFCRWIQQQHSRFFPDDEDYHILYQVPYDCKNISKYSALGTGNWLQFIYEFRLLAAFSQVNFGKYVDIQLMCKENEEEEEDNGGGGGDHDNQSFDEILPWLMGHFSSQATKRYLDRHYGNESSFHTVSCGERDLHVGWMVHFLRFDLRWMAIALVGLPQKEEQEGEDEVHHPAHSWVTSLIQQEEEEQKDGIGQSYYSEQLPHHHHHMSNFSSGLLTNVTLDEVVIHFRCGDIMYRDNPFFRFLKFTEYSKRINPNVKSIGIVTQPFGLTKTTTIRNTTTSSTMENATITDNDPNGDDNNNDKNGTASATTTMTMSLLGYSSQTRAVDVEDTFRSYTCQRVVYAMVEHLQEEFPKARITIHNGPDETISLAYARLIMAKQAFAAPDSTFSIFPVLASFGIGYHMSPTPTIYSSSFKNGWLHSLQETIEKNIDHAMGGNTTDDGGRIEFMSIPKEDTLCSRHTYHMREEEEGNEMTVADRIVEWFRNESIRFIIPIKK